MKRRYLVIYGRWDGARGCWHEAPIARRTLEGAMRLADRRAEAHRREMSFSYSTRNTSYVFVQNAKTGDMEYEHPGFRVPSVGELGWTP